MAAWSRIRPRSALAVAATGLAFCGACATDAERAEAYRLPPEVRRLLDKGLLPAPSQVIEIYDAQGRRTGTAVIRP